MEIINTASEVPFRILGRAKDALVWSRHTRLNSRVMNIRSLAAGHSDLTSDAFGGDRLSVVESDQGLQLTYWRDNPNRETAIQFVLTAEGDNFGGLAYVRATSTEYDDSSMDGWARQHVVGGPAVNNSLPFAEVMSELKNAKACAVTARHGHVQRTS